MKRVLVAFVMVIAMSAMAAPPCWACSCADLGKKEQAKTADVIFTGKVVDVEKGGSYAKVRFKVAKVYKGGTKRYTNVFTESPDPEECGFGYSFKEDTKYTVFADWGKDKKYTDICSGTKKGEINPDNYGLGEPYAPKSDE